MAVGILSKKRKREYDDVDLERAIQLSRIESCFEPCDLCGLVLKACDLINEPPLLFDIYYQYMSVDERARMFLRALAPEALDRVIAAYTNEQESLRAGGCYCFNSKCLRLISANCGTVLKEFTDKLIGERTRRVCSSECYLQAADQCIEVQCELYHLDIFKFIKMAVIPKSILV